jgi:SOS-response transcriptional repressor LexA
VPRVQLDKTFIVEVSGHSMRELYNDRDLVVGERCEEVHRDSTYAFYWKGAPGIKHIERRGDKIRLIPENQAFDVKTVTADNAEDFRVIGEVKAKITLPER